MSGRSWWARVGSNHRPTGYEPGALTTELQALTPQCAEPRFGVQGPGGVQRSRFRVQRGTGVEFSVQGSEFREGRGVEFSVQGSEFRGGRGGGQEPTAKSQLYSERFVLAQAGPGPNGPLGGSRGRGGTKFPAQFALPPDEGRPKTAAAGGGLGDGGGPQIPRSAAQSSATQRRAHATRRTGHAWQRSHHHGR